MTSMTIDFQDVNNLTSQTLPPSGRQQSITRILKSLESTQPPRKFLEDLALRSKNRFQSKRRVFRDMPDGFALLLMCLQMIGWIILSLACLFVSIDNDHLDLDGIKGTIWELLKYSPIFIWLSLSTAFLSSLFLHLFTNFTIHFVSISVSGFVFYAATFNLPNRLFSSGNFASLLTFLFLTLYYVRGLKHLPLTCK